MRKKSTMASKRRLLGAATVLSISSALAGCSSDVMRFSDDFYTSAVPRGAAAPQTAQAENYGQPNYDPSIDRSTTGSIAPQTVQRSALPAPGGAEIAVPQPAVGLGAGAVNQPLPANTSPIVTGSVTAAAPAATRTPPAVPVTTRGGWTTEGARQVTLRPGETVEAVSRRYGVPEKAILEVNGLKSSASASSGQSLLIPTFSRPGSPAAAPKNVRQVAIAQPPAAPARKAAAPQRDAVIANGGRYTVVSGDTLSAISRKTGASVTSIRQVNGLSSDTIRIGQSLIVPGLSADSATQTAKAPELDPVVTGSVEKAPDTKKMAAYTPPATSAKKTTGSITTIETRDTAKAPESTGVNAMRWPVQGRVVNAFAPGSGANANDGIDISVPAGTAVKAAENGVVIYAGDGLKELGKTVLVRHSDGVVTVYGHVSEIGVKRGETVRRGQQIALSGMSGAAKQPQLHFEVRKNSSPVDPVKFLQ